MTFLAPWAWFFALLAVPIFIFYILKIRLRRIPVATTIFWQQVFDEKVPRSFWQKLRHLLSLLAQLLFLLFLVGSLAQPLLPWESAEARRVVVILDNSASMNATDIVPNRLSVAKEKAAAALSSLRHFDEAAVLTAGTTAQVACGLTNHQGTLKEAIQKVPATDGPTKLQAAIEMARQLLAGHAHGQIVLVTDACSDDMATLQDVKDIEVVRIGDKADNVGITRFQVRRSLQDPLGYEILVEVRNATDALVECRLELDLNKDIVDVIPLKLQPNDSYRKVFDKTSAKGGVLTAKINHSDVMPIDNEAQAILPERVQQPVLLVTSGNLFLKTVLEANPLVKLTVASKVPEQIPPGTVVVLHRQDVKTIPTGNFVIIEPPGASDLWQHGGVVQNPIVAKQEREHPLMAHLRLDNVLMPEAKMLTPTPAVKSQVLASAANGEPLLVAWDRPNGKVLALTVNLDQGDLPLRTAFPIIMLNALSWFANSKGELQEARSTGDVLDVQLASVGPEVEPTLVSPTGVKRSLPKGQEKVTIGPLDTAGIWKIELIKGYKQLPAMEIACNLANPRESDLRPVAAPGTQQSAALSFGSWGPIWYILLALATVLIIVEWCLYQRRWIS